MCTRILIHYKKISYSLFFFFMAGLCEIGGGYLVWLWLRESYSWMLGAFGGFVLFLYGVIPTFQNANFHRTYAAYGGIFIIMAIIWGYLLEKNVPDIYDIIGIIISSIGVTKIFCYPRKGDKQIGIDNFK
jgi:small multidrug resistance family-3 protein